MAAMGGMAGDGEYSACLDNINELDRLGDELKAIGIELRRGGGCKAGLMQRAEDATESGRVLSQETGQYLKNKLQSPSVDRQTRAQLERLGRQFQTAGSKFEAVSLQVLMHPNKAHGRATREVSSRARTHANTAAHTSFVVFTCARARPVTHMRATRPRAHTHIYTHTHTHTYTHTHTHTHTHTGRPS